MWDFQKDLLFVIYLLCFNTPVLNSLNSWKKILGLFVTTWIDLVGIMLSEISDRKTNTIGVHLYVESKKRKTKQNKNPKEQTNEQYSTDS